MSRKRLIVSLLMILIFVFALATVPHSCKRAYELGIGGAFDNIITSQNLRWDKMSDIERAPYIAQTNKSGFQLAIYTLLGQYIPFYLFILIIIGQLSRPTSRSLRAFLWISFLVVWLIGWFFLSLCMRQWNHYWSNEPYSVSLGGAFLIYIAAAIFFGIIMGIGKLLQHLFRKRTVQPSSIELNTNKVCGEFPEVCYKAFDCKKYAEDFMYRGTFRLNCLGYCRNMEDESRRDSTEGYGHTKEPDIVTVGWVSQNPVEKTVWTKEISHQEHHIEIGNPVFCFCTCLPDVDPVYMSKRFSGYIVKINDPKKLAEDINDYFISKGQRFLIEGCKVVYNKGQKLEKKLTVNERLDMPYKQKPESFCLECEFRIVAIKFGEPCNREGCKYLDGQSEQVDPWCKSIEINLKKPLNYLSMMNL